MLETFNFQKNFLFRFVELAVEIVHQLDAQPRLSTEFFPFPTEPETAEKAPVEDGDV
jgi:hypothetical protein